MNERDRRWRTRRTAAERRTKLQRGYCGVIDRRDAIRRIPPGRRNVDPHPDELYRLEFTITGGLGVH